MKRSTTDRIRTVALALLLVVLSAACAHTRSGAPIAVSETVYASPGVQELIRQTAGKVTLQDDERIVCSRVSPGGTHRRVKYCRTREEDKKIRERSRYVLQNAADNAEP